MNRSTNLLYKTNPRLYISDPFAPQPYNNFNPSMRGIPQPFSIKDNYDPVKHRIDNNNATKTGSRRDTIYSNSVAQNFRNYETPATDYSAPNNYPQFFPNTAINQSQPQPLLNHNLNMRLKTKDCQINDFNRPKEVNTQDLTDIYQKSRFQNLACNQFIPQTQTPFFNFKETRPVETKAEESVFTFDFNSSQPIVKNLSQTQDNHSFKKVSFDISNEATNEEKQSQISRKKSQGNQFSSKVDELLELVEKHEMNPISLLNEVSGKLKKKFEYKTSESFSGRNKV